MAIHLLIFRYLPTPRRFRNPNFHFAQTRRSSSTADIFWDLLQQKGSIARVERTLAQTRAKIDSSSVENFLKKCSSRPALGLRFFVWAGQQSNYRHSPLMYSKACEFLEIRARPESLNDVLEAYRREGCLVSVKTFKVILNLCREAKLADHALGFLRKMKEFNCRPDTVSYNVVIRLVSENDDMVMARDLMQEMALVGLYPDMITYITMIKGFCNVGWFDDAHWLLKTMRFHGCVPNVVMYSVMIDGVCKAGNLEMALELLGEMERESGELAPNVVTYTSLIQNFCESGRSKEGLKVLDRMGERGCTVNRVTVSTLIKGFCDEGLIDEAYGLVERVVGDGSLSKDQCYSSLVVSLLRVKNVVEAEKLVRRMLASGCRPDGLACSSLIREICSERRFLDGFEWFCEIKRKEYLLSIDSDCYAILLVGLCQLGRSVEAERVISAMAERGIRLKAPYADGIVEYLKKVDEDELASHLRSIVR